MAIIKNIGSNATPSDIAADRPVQGKEPAPKSKGVHLLEGLLGKDDRLVVPMIEGRNKIQTIKQEAKKKGWLKSLHLRHTIIVASFIIMVAIPASLATLYMIFIASNQYHSSASFAVRSIDTPATSDILGMFSQASSGNTGSDSYILMDFVQSERMLEAVEKKFDLDAIYAARGLDYFYGLQSGKMIEDRLAFWRRMIGINFDHASGIMQFQIKAFEPQQAQDIAKFVIEQSDALINNLSAVARDGVLRAAQEEVKVAETRLAQARVGVREYRDQSQEVDPVEGAKLAAQLIGGLEAQLVQLNSDLATARTQMSDDTPRIRVIKARIASIEELIQSEKQRLGSGTVDASQNAPSSDVAGRIQKYEALETEREFAERAYTASLASLEKARLDASNRQRYLAVFIEPTLSQLAQYPSRFLNSFLVTIGLLFAWLVLIMSYYNIRDRT